MVFLNRGQGKKNKVKTIGKKKREETYFTIEQDNNDALLSRLELGYLLAADRLRSRFQLVAFQIRSSVTIPRRSLPARHTVLFIQFTFLFLDSLSLSFIYDFLKDAKMEFLLTICLPSLKPPHSRFYSRRRRQTWGGIKNVMVDWTFSSPLRSRAGEFLSPWP